MKKQELFVKYEVAIEDFVLQAFKDELLQQDPYAFWNPISKMEDPVCGSLRYPLLSISQLAKALLILPHGNADTERVFSKMNLSQYPGPHIYTLLTV